MRRIKYTGDHENSNYRPFQFASIPRFSSDKIIAGQKRCETILLVQK